MQNELYWAYLLISFAGMRNSEIGTLKVADVIREAETWMFDLGTNEKRIPNNETKKPPRRRQRLRIGRDIELADP